MKKIIVYSKADLMVTKNILKTRWKVEKNRITLYPTGICFLLGIVLAILFAIIVGISVAAKVNFPASPPFMVLLALVVVIFFCFGFNAVEFDNESGIMRKKLMGFITILTVKFEQLYGVKALNNVSGGYSYRMYLKESRYGRGTAVSSGYQKTEDPNAAFFVNEIVPIIHKFLDQHGMLEIQEKSNITNYKYFKEQGKLYKVKNNKIFLLVVGVVLILLGINELLPTAFLTSFDHDEKPIIMGIGVFLGLIILLTEIMKVSVDTAIGKVERQNLIGLGKKSYLLKDFMGIKTLRKTMNLAYTGTDIYMHFTPIRGGQPDALLLITLKKSQEIERFMDELSQILEINTPQEKT
ncbi:succinate dehydrogenase hydrophobic anchor subunit [Pedobacter sp. UYP30]|uniref:hypothetical protein n=1 Tax=Pedobacter sp. UYP30 TaxID=1756400 RepID=UPI003399FC78